MWTHHLKIAFRSLIRNKVYSLINIFGLATGMAGCILLLLWVGDEMGYDEFHQNNEEVYRVMSYGTRYMQSGFDGSPAPISLRGRDQIPEIINSTTFRDLGETLFMSGGRGFYEKGGLVADTTFFNFFSFNLLHGNRATLFSDPYRVVITEDMARKYFDTSDVLGKVLETKDYRLVISGVLEKIPDNSSLQFDFVIPLSLYRELNRPVFWGSFMYANFIRVNEGTDTEVLAHKITEFARDQKCPQVVDDGVVFKLQPLKDVHFDGEHNYWRFFYKSADRRYLIAFSIIAAFILLIACINYINLSTARAERRSKEVGLRKVIGAGRSRIILQFMGESMLITFISMIIAMILVEILRPAFNTLSGKEVILNYDSPGFLLGAGAIFIITGLLAGCYPAIILSHFRPVKVFKGINRTGRGGSLFRRALVVFQFTIGSVLIIGTLVMYKQMAYIKHKKLGFSKEHVVYIPLKENLGSSYSYVKNSLLNDPNILSVSAASYMTATANSRCSGCFTWEGYEEKDQMDIIQLSVDFDYFKTLGIPLMEGRTFSAGFSTDSTLGFMLNESAAERIGKEHVLGLACEYGGFGSTLRQGPVIGIYKDIHSKSLREEIEPEVVWIMKEPAEHDSRGVMLAKINGLNVDEAIARLEAAWNEVNTLTPFEFHFLDQTYEDLYANEKKTIRVVLYFTLLAIIISCLGMFGLATFMAERRAKEIGVRKVNGAGVGDIVYLLSKDYLKWVIIAFLLASPMAWYVMEKILESYAYRTETGPLLYINAFLIVLIIALVSLGYQSLKVALTKPVDALRYE